LSDNLTLTVLESIVEAFETLTGRLKEIRDALKQSKTTLTIERISSLMPEDLVKTVTFLDEGDIIKIKPKQYLGAETFARLAANLKDNFDGEYVSQGRDSHFKIKK